MDKSKNATGGLVSTPYATAPSQPDPPAKPKNTDWNPRARTMDGSHRSLMRQVKQTDVRTSSKSKT